MHGGGNAVCREHDRLALGHLGLLVDEHGAARFQVAHDVEVVDDLLAHIDRRPVQLECLLDGLDGALDPGAVATWGREENFLDHAFIVASRVSTAPPSRVGEPSGGVRHQRQRDPLLRGVVAAGLP